MVNIIGWDGERVEMRLKFFIAMKRYPQELLDQIVVYLRLKQAIILFSDYAAMIISEYFSPHKSCDYGKTGDLSAEVVA